MKVRKSKRRRETLSLSLLPYVISTTLYNHTRARSNNTTTSKIWCTSSRSVRREGVGDLFFLTVNIIIIIIMDPVKMRTYDDDDSKVGLFKTRKRIPLSSEERILVNRWARLTVVLKYLDGHYLNQCVVHRYKNKYFSYQDTLQASGMSCARARRCWVHRHRRSLLFC
jgi:hypothetical protein